MYEKVPVGITMPYVRGDSGFFNQTYSDMQRGTTNLKMLLMTAKGERPMMPTYGSDLHEIIFEQNVDGIVDDLLEDAVKEAAEIWMPEVFIKSVISQRKLDKEPSSVTLMIKFSLRNIPDSEQELNLEF
jgi:phage baseplate assembly protein W